ncbi:hypothetical protein SLS54_000062 [Diplodia seriata]
MAAGNGHQRPPATTGKAAEGIAVQSRVHVIVVVGVPFTLWMLTAPDQPPIGDGNEYGYQCLSGGLRAFTACDNLAQYLDASAEEEDKEDALQLQAELRTGIRDGRRLGRHRRHRARAMRIAEV